MDIGCGVGGVGLWFELVLVFNMCQCVCVRARPFSERDVLSRDFKENLHTAGIGVSRNIEM